MKGIVKMVIVLTSICILSALALSVAYNSTHERIEENKRNELMKNIEMIFESDVYVAELETKGVERAFDVYDLDGNLLGQALMVEHPGYQGHITILVGVKHDKVLGIEILSHTETPGLGARIEEDAFKSQFRNQNPRLMEADTITGATISSEAVIEAVKKHATEFLENDV